MTVGTSDRDDVFHEAITIASTAERDAFIARACDGNAARRRHVEELVAAHFHAATKQHKPTVASYVTPPVEQPNGAPAVNHAATTPTPPHHSSSHWLATATAILLATTVASSAAAVWALRSESDLRRQTAAASAEREEAVKQMKEFEHEVAKAEASRAETTRERARALAAVHATQSALDDATAVLAFFQERVLSGGRPGGWAGGEGKNVTLRKAVDAAEPIIAKTFAERPLVEAAIRETIAATYLDMEEAALAVTHLERALALWEAVLGPGDPAASSCRNKLAVAYRAAGRTDEAGQLFNQNPANLAHANALAVKGALLMKQRSPAEAEAKLRQCLKIRQQLQPDAWTTSETKVALAESLLAQKKYADAEPLLLSGYEGMKQRETKMPAEARARMTTAIEDLVRLYDGWSKPDQAGRWRKELNAARK